MHIPAATMHSCPCVMRCLVEDFPKFGMLHVLAQTEVCASIALCKSPINHVDLWLGAVVPLLQPIVDIQ